MWARALAAGLLLASSLTLAEKWPYNRYHRDDGKGSDKKQFGADPEDLFIQWFRGIVKNDPTGELQKTFLDHASKKVSSTADLFDHLDIPSNVTALPLEVGAVAPSSSQDEPAQLFSHLGYALEPKCTENKTNWWYRTYDGSCNWLEKDHSNIGAVGMGKSRDYGQHYYADGISKPREGPNPREISNLIFKRKKRLYYEHTPLLLGLIEFIMHDVTYSQDSTTEFIDVLMPEDEKDFYKNTTLRVWRTAAVPGTGTSKENPRENVNMATTWLDISSLYGSTKEVADKLRSFKGGKLITQEVKARGTNSTASYLPYNSMGVPINTRPGVDKKDLFAGGDARTNEDWMMLGVHTLMLREHNRLCDILAKQHPEYDDERLYQTARLVMSAKYALIANSYQMAYWTDKMPWPRDDGFPLYRQMYGETALKINPANTYPWPLVTKDNNPMVVSAEMAVVYRFHEFIISDFPIKDANNNTLWEQDLFDTGFNSTGFINAGLENVLRGMVASTIPNFKSGVDENFRTAGKYRGKPFDIVTWSIIHEREQGLPTFNNYFRAYNKADPKVEVPIRNRFEDFSSDPEMVGHLKRLYKTPDDVDLVVGIQLDEEMFPGTTVPKSALIISLFSLFGMGNSDRFSIGFAMMRCLLVDKPWDCHPSNALEELLWKPVSKENFPNFRIYDEFWLTELDLQAHGTNLLWRLITENSEIKCVQHHPLFPADPETNPVLCALPKQGLDVKNLSLTGVELVLALVRQHKVELIAAAAALVAGIFIIKSMKDARFPPVMHGWPVIGEALAFQKDPKSLLLKGFQKYGRSPSRSFGIKLASMTHFVVTRTEDLQMMKEDNPWEVKFSLHGFLKFINAPIITKKENFESDIHTKLIRSHFGDPKTVAAFGPIIEEAAKSFLARNPLSQGAPQRYEGLNDYFSRYITFVVSRCIVGPDGYDNSELLKTFLKFNDDAINAMGISSMLPSFMQGLAAISINKDSKTIRKVLKPIIEKRRQTLSQPATQPVFLDFIMEAVDDNERCADLVAFVVWAGLTNLQATFSSTILDIINEPGLQSIIRNSLRSATPANLNTFSRSPEWSLLRSSMFESIRLCGPITAPARLCNETVPLASQPELSLPKGQVATLSVYYTHRQSEAWGPTARKYHYERFLAADPPIGEPQYISWGLEGPHTCPGRWFGQAAIQLIVKILLDTYEFKQDRDLEDEEKYIYSAGNVSRKEVGAVVKKR